MAKFGRFEFKSETPAETFEGDFIALESGYVRVFKSANGSTIPDMNPPRLIAAIHLDNGQSVREIKSEEQSPDEKTVKYDKPLFLSEGRKFR
jgi:hypothetical protein